MANDADIITLKDKTASDDQKWKRQDQDYVDKWFTLNIPGTDNNYLAVTLDDSDNPSNSLESKRKNN